MADSEFTLPDVGEGLTEAEIVSWKVKAGDTVEINQVLVEIETAKSLVELPSPFAGTVGALLVEEGTTVDVGTPIIIVSDGGASAPAPVAPNRDTVDDVADTEASITHENPGEGAVLVGYGTKGHAGSRRRRAGVDSSDSLRQAQGPGAARGAGAAQGPGAGATAAHRAPVSSVPAAAASSIIAKPPIRKLAKDLSVDLAEVVATGLAGEITRDDVVRQARQASVFRNIETPAWADEREEKIPVKGVRKAIATAMSTSTWPGS